MLVYVLDPFLEGGPSITDYKRVAPTNDKHHALGMGLDPGLDNKIYPSRIYLSGT